MLESHYRVVLNRKYPVMNAPLSDRTQTAILSRLPALATERLAPEVAKFILEIELAAEDRQRLDELAEKARQGTLSGDEEAEIEEYRRAGRVVEMLKLRARLSQRRQPA